MVESHTTIVSLVSMVCVNAFSCGMGESPNTQQFQGADLIGCPTHVEEVPKMIADSFGGYLTIV